MKEEELYNDTPENSYSTDSERKPQEMGYDIFHLRTDPSPLIKNFQLFLMSSYENDKGQLCRYANTQPLANDQGIREMVFQLKAVMNNHTVQGNLTSNQEHQRIMLNISHDITRIFWSKRKDWNIDINNVNPIINAAQNMVDLFLTRTIGNSERVLYGEQFKETTSREVKTQPRKPNVFERFMHLGGRNQ